ncbi:TetR/AcrR family transcriptional regulator [Vulcaniibacterium gelatinicum]|uniref:TetR/AcrR family transcriptional regulator n=1 Tax=Vulcaniibacterium gelatinicum TaxID=2598725 RepID=UPI0011C91221|nr:TetR/AcrR family transcriptional regulator [Vulcaniibacterium gelatinicum]
MARRPAAARPTARSAPSRAPREPARAPGGEPARPAKRRPAGRPAGDGPDLRERLLDAAIACFVREGIGAATLRRIAAEAGVNPALVHYYFGDKARLQEAVVAERLMPAFAHVREAVLGAGDAPAALVAGFVRGMAEVVARHPWLPPLWVREVLCEGGALREVLLARFAPQLPQLLVQKLAQAQRAGTLDPGLDPRLVVVSLVGLTLFPAASAPLWRSMFDAEDISPERLRDHALALLGRGLGLEGGPTRMHTDPHG